MTLQKVLLIFFAWLITTLALDCGISFILWAAIGLTGKHALTFATYGDYFNAWLPTWGFLMLAVVVTATARRLR